MKRSRFYGALCVFALVLAAGIANAATPVAPTSGCESYGLDLDRDRYCTPDPARPAPTDPAALAAHNIGLGAVDCVPGDSRVNPGAVEIAGNGIDDDCNALTEDRLEPSVLMYNAAARRCAPTDGNCLTKLRAEIKLCSTAGNHCRVDFNNGYMFPDPGYFLIDEDCDGVRKVMTQAERQAFIIKKAAELNVDADKWQPRADGFCGNVSSNGCGGSVPVCGGSGVRPKAAKPATTPAQENKQNANIAELRGDVDDINKKLKKDRGLIGGLRTDVDGLKTSLATTNGVVNDLTITINGDGQNPGLVKDVQDLKLELGNTKTRLDTVTGEVAVVKEKTDQTAKRVEEESVFTRFIARHGMLLEGAVGYGLVYQSELTMRSPTGANLGSARGNIAHQFRLGANIGLDAPDFRTYLSLRGIPTLDKGPDGSWDANGSAEVGAAHEFRLAGDSSTYIGPYVGYFVHHAGGDVLNSNTESDGGSLALSITQILSNPPGACKSGLNFRIGVSRERYGSEGAAFKPTTDGGFTYGGSVEYIGGFGALL